MTVTSGENTLSETIDGDADGGYDHDVSDKSDVDDDCGESDADDYGGGD